MGAVAGDSCTRRRPCATSTGMPTATCRSSCTRTSASPSHRRGTARQQSPACWWRNTRWARGTGWPLPCATTRSGFCASWRPLRSAASRWRSIPCGPRTRWPTACVIPVHGCCLPMRSAWRGSPSAGCRRACTSCRCAHSRISAPAPVRWRMCWRRRPPMRPCRRFRCTRTTTRSSSTPPVRRVTPRGHCPAIETSPLRCCPGNSISLRRYCKAVRKLRRRSNSPPSCWACRCFTLPARTRCC